MKNEIWPSQLQVYDKNCKGCKRHKSDVMISYMDSESADIIDMFITQDEAKSLVKELLKIIEQNELG
jgi:hypothetical protein